MMLGVSENMDIKIPMFSKTHVAQFDVSVALLCDSATVCLHLLYGICGSRNYRRFGRRATDVKKGNAGPKLHWLVWEKGGFPALPCERCFLEDTKGQNGNIWAQSKLFLDYCL